MIDHKVLIKKLKHIGFNNEAIKMMNSYLNDRSQEVFLMGLIQKD